MGTRIRSNGLTPSGMGRRTRRRVSPPGPRSIVQVPPSSAAPVVVAQECQPAAKRSRGTTRAGRIAPVAVNRILAVPDPSGRAVTWAREAAERFEAELAIIVLDPEEPDAAAAIV